MILRISTIVLIFLKFYYFAEDIITLQLICLNSLFSSEQTFIARYY